MQQRLELRSTNVLINGVFRPALIRVALGKIQEISDYDTRNNEWERIELGEQYLGPGLIDLAPQSICSNASQVGVTTVCTVRDEPDDYKFNVRHFQNSPETTSNLLCAAVAQHPADTSLENFQSVLYVQADCTNLLASPFRGKSEASRQIETGNLWRTGRSRRGSNDDDFDRAEEDGLHMPQEMVHVLLSRERGEFKGSATLNSSESSSMSSKTRFRPPPIQPVRTVDSFSPKEFLRYYRVYLTLRPVQTEVDGVDQMMARPNTRGILRISSAQALRRVPKHKYAGTTIAHLCFCADDIKDGATWLKLDPPIRERCDQQALLQRGLDPHEAMFCISSGHHENSLEYGDFERAMSNGQTIKHWLPAMWMISRRSSSSLSSQERFATLWCKSSEIPARMAGLQSMKGCIAVGMDADLVVFDVNTQDYRVPKPSVFQDQLFTGRISLSIIRGCISWKL